jgi:DNA-binding response OmpR family regulator
VLRVLIVDNDADVSEALKGGMEDHCAAAVTCAQTGAAATRALGSLPLDLAVIDTELPDISSFELAESAANWSVPVLLISGHPDGQELCQANDYPWLAKPFSLSQLAATARQVFDDSRQNIVRLHDAYARLQANLAQAKAAVTEAHALVSETRRLRDHSIATREATKLSKA